MLLKSIFSIIVCIQAQQHCMIEMPGQIIISITCSYNNVQLFIILRDHFLVNAIIVVLQYSRYCS